MKPEQPGRWRTLKYALGGLLLLTLLLGALAYGYRSTFNTRFAAMEQLPVSACQPDRNGRWQVPSSLGEYPPLLARLLQHMEGETVDVQLVRRFLLTPAESESEIPGDGRFRWREMALQLQYSQYRRLELFINHVFMGEARPGCSIYGLKAASQFYFNRRPENLSPAAVALLSVQVRAPKYFDPVQFPDRIRVLRDQRLQWAREQRLITPDEYQQALAEPLPTRTHAP
ncbi:MAG TPA: transglycosylase domain-containing protein [Thiolinea sp.]|nr:transglycosylase domain-containing protein [Thiolinea sp.]